MFYICISKCYSSLGKAAIVVFHDACEPAESQVIFLKLYVISTLVLSLPTRPELYIVKGTLPPKNGRK